MDARGHVLSERCIDDEIPFEIPESWEWVRLGALCVKVGSGSTPSGGRAIYKPEGAMLLRSQNVYNDGLRLDDVARFDYSLYNKRGSHVLPGDILLNITGASIGRSAIVPSVFGDADVNQHVLILRQIDKDINAYIHLFITSPVVQMAIMNVQVGATKEGLSAAKASNLLIPIAPCLEQERIVDRVENLVPCIAEYELLESARERLDSELPDRLRKSILQMAVEGKLVEQNPADEPASALLDRIRAERAKLIKEKKIKAPKGGESVIYRASDGGYYEKRGKGEAQPIEVPFDIPSNWEWARVSTVFNLVRGSGIKRTEVTDEGIPCVRYGELYTTYEAEIVKPTSKTSEDVFDKAQKLLPDEAVATLTGENDTDIGRTVVNSTNQTIAFGGDLLGLKGGYIDGHFAALSMNSPYMGIQRTALASGNIIVHLSADKIGSFLIAVPPIEEQRRIVSRVTSLLAAIG